MKKKTGKVAVPKPLNHMEKLFCANYVAGGQQDPVTCWLDTFKKYASHSKHAEGLFLAHRSAKALVARPEVQAEIQRLIEKAGVAAGVTPRRVIEKLAAIAFADARDLVAHEYFNCRHCWGADFKRQVTQSEIDKAIAYALQTAQRSKRKYIEPEFPGGLGWDEWEGPNPECPECSGRGVARVVINDTRAFSAQAAALYAGVKETKNGTELIMHSQIDAIKALAVMFGITPDTVKHYMPELADKVDDTVPDLAGLHPADVINFYKEFMG